ncbi:hypothetical protein [Labrenzia sp. THAF82]|uniref:hypothetical protein n=1 Tax=Labrenzia sp. THAF82 TaxID=2587861 RepID=UPI001268FDEC|nr:hypothetical protein [Labrenzia sp. THAF82]
MDEFEMYFAGKCIVQDQGNPVQGMLAHPQGRFSTGLSDAGPALRVWHQASIWREKPFVRITDTRFKSFHANS